MVINSYKCRYLLCDSLKAYKSYVGKVKYDKLLTLSPTLILKKGIKSESLYKPWSTTRLKKFQQSIYPCNAEVFNKLQNNQFISNEENLVINIALNKFHKYLFRIGSLPNLSRNDKLIFIKHIKYPNNFYQDTNPIWDKLFFKHKNFTTIEYIEKNKKSKKKKIQTNLIQRIYFAGIQTLKVRIFKKIYYYFNFTSKSKNLILINENELLLEEAGKFINKGYKILDLKNIIKDQYTENFDNKKFNMVFKSLETIIRKRINNWVQKSYRRTTLCICKDIIMSELKSYLIWHNTFKDIFKKNKNINFKNTLFFCNAPANPKALAIKNIINKKGIPLIAFQHGVSSEISNSHLYNRIFHDTSACDIYISFNKKSSEIAKKNIFSSSSAITYKGSERFKKVANKIFSKREKNSLLYISNNLYKGNFGSLSTWTTDLDMANNEIYIINQILSKLKKQIFYKPYPEINKRYYDKDPAIIEAENKANIKVIDKNTDARYLMCKYEMIVCGSASSTLSWALKSNKPLIFLNYKNHAALKKKPYTLLEKSVFLYNFNSRYFKRNILRFFSQKSNKIIRQWEEKSYYREKFIKEYISDNENKLDLFKEIQKEVKAFKKK